MVTLAPALPVHLNGSDGLDTKTSPPLVTDSISSERSLPKTSTPPRSIPRKGFSYSPGDANPYIDNGNTHAGNGWALPSVAEFKDVTDDPARHDSRQSYPVMIHDDPEGPDSMSPRTASGLSFTPGPPNATTNDPVNQQQANALDSDKPIPSLASPRKPHPRSLSAYLAAHPRHTAKKAIRKTYPKSNPILRFLRRFTVRHSVIHGLSEAKMEQYEERQGQSKRADAGWRLEGEPEIGPDGKPRALVSELFWKMYLSLLPSLERDPMSGLVAPPLLGSTGTMPLSIISLIPDIIRHYRDVIVRAEKEVFLVTNYWQ